MVFDDVVVGSGLTGLATVMGLVGRGRRVRVVADYSNGILQHYGTSQTPSAYRGQGGLGRYWHGVIPLSATSDVPVEKLAALIELFYSSSAVRAHLGGQQLLVPWKPIRPFTHLKRLQENDPNLEIDPRRASALHDEAKGMAVSVEGERVLARRVWLAAGATATPGLLATYLGTSADIPRRISDHVIAYGGQVSADEQAAENLRTLRRCRDGLLLPTQYDENRTTLYMLRPAKFEFSELDYGFEQRAVFGLPTSKATAKIAGHLSAGLVAEALFNRTGLGKNARRYNVYFQVAVPTVYDLEANGELGPPDLSLVAKVIAKAREAHPFEQMQMTTKPELFLPGIHLHGSLLSTEQETLKAHPALRVVDASNLDNPGPDHHSFRLMALSYDAALRS